MIGNAFMLMIVGMGVVFVFLVLLNISISLLAHFTRKHTRREETAVTEKDHARRMKKKKKVSDRGDSSILTAVISSAIHAYRNA